MVKNCDTKVNRNKNMDTKGRIVQKTDVKIEKTK